MCACAAWTHALCGGGSHWFMRAVVRYYERSPLLEFHHRDVLNECEGGLVRFVLPQFISRF